jgi:cyclase
MEKRLIPVLLLDANRRLVKTLKFGERTYIGDPFNVIRLFNEKEVDELVVLDIDAGPGGGKPDIGFMRELASECFMPLAYGGGIHTLKECEELNRIGIEKFVIGDSAFEPGFIGSVSTTFGSQSVVVCVDYVGEGDGARCISRSGGRAHRRGPLEHAAAMQDAGAGEIILQSVDRDGVRQGMDLPMISQVSRRLEVPVVALGGACDVPDLLQAMEAGASAVASGSAFCFVGRLRAVLVTYPQRVELEHPVGRASGGLGR